MFWIGWKTVLLHHALITRLDKQNICTCRRGYIAETIYTLTASDNGCVYCVCYSVNNSLTELINRQTFRSCMCYAAAAWQTETDLCFYRKDSETNPGGMDVRLEM